MGQTPPPMGGQALMIQRLIDCRFVGVNLRHVRMGFSASMAEVGRFRISKVLELFSLIARVVVWRIVERRACLYYPPAGPNHIPVYRDFAFLIATRWMFKCVIFHFHAGGLSEIYPQLGRAGRALFRVAYGRPDIAIRAAEEAPDDPSFLRAVHRLVIPYGIEDEASLDLGSLEATGDPRILFVGVLTETKGVLTLLEACAQLLSNGHRFKLDIAGEFASDDFQSRVVARIEELGLRPTTTLHGIVTGEAKRDLFRGATVFCFPTHFESESLGVVIIEAMQFSLPVVATRWRGIPAVVEHERTGFLVPIKSPAATADRIARLLGDEELRAQMGRRGRARYERDFSVEAFRTRMQEVFDLAREIVAARAT